MGRSTRQSYAARRASSSSSRRRAMPDAIAVAGALDFVLALRRRWADTLYPHLRLEFDVSTGVHQPGDISDTARVVHALPTYPWFAWLERGSQKMLWRATADAVAFDESRLTDGDSAPAAALTLDPSLELPDWYTEWDIHLQPGGVWSRDSAAAVYELGAKLVMLGENDDYKIHRLFTET